MTAAALDPRPRQWTLAFAGALLLHLAVALAYTQFPDAGTWATGQGGIRVGLGPAGGAPGEQTGEARPEEVQTTAATDAEADELSPEEVTEVLPDPAEAVPSVPEAAPVVPTEAAAVQVPEPAGPALAETVPLYAQEVPAEAPQPPEEVAASPQPAAVAPSEATEVVTSEAVEVVPSDEVEVVETRRAMATPQPPRAKPAAPPEETPDVEPPAVAAATNEAPAVETTAAESPVEEAPRGTASGSAEAVETAGNRGKSGSGSTAASGSAQGDSGGGAAGSTADYKAMLLAWLERHKVYPRRARLRRQEGTAELYFVVDRQGQLLEYRLAKSSGHKLLDQEVTAMIERAAPLPAVPDDPQALRFVFNVPVSFDLR